MQWRAAAGNFTEVVGLHEVRPGCWNLRQIPGFVPEKQDALVSNLLAIDYLVLSASERMERVGDSEPARPIRRYRCSHWDT